MKVCFVRPKSKRKKFVGANPTVDFGRGIYQPLTFLSFATLSEQMGHKTFFIDGYLEKNNDEIINKIVKIKPEALIFKANMTNFYESISLIRNLKKRINVKVLIIGDILRYYAKEVMNYPEIDFGIITYYPKSFVKVLNSIEKRKTLKIVKGVTFRKGKKVIINYNNDPYAGFEELPPPARQLINNKKYFDFGLSKKNFSFINSAKGCPHRCIFCNLAEKPYHPRKIDEIVDEIEDGVKKFRIFEWCFRDPCFTLNKNRVIAICKEMKRRNLHKSIIWRCYSRVDSIDEELCREMSEAGCNTIMFGIESGDQKILNNMKKDITIEQIRRAIEISKKYNIKCLGFFIIGCPGETRNTIKKTIEFAKSLDLDFVSFNRIFQEVGSYSYQEWKKFYGYDYFSDYIAGKVEDIQLPIFWTKLSIEELDKMVNLAYRSVCFRYSYIMKKIKDIKTIENFKSLLNIFFGLINVRN